MNCETGGVASCSAFEIQWLLDDDSRVQNYNGNIYIFSKLLSAS